MLLEWVTVGVMTRGIPSGRYQRTVDRWTMRSVRSIPFRGKFSGSHFAKKTFTVDSPSKGRAGTSVFVPWIEVSLTRKVSP